jgi:hypothetical protein
MTKMTFLQGISKESPIQQTESIRFLVDDWLEYIQTYGMARPDPLLEKGLDILNSR